MTDDYGHTIGRIPKNLENPDQNQNDNNNDHEENNNNNSNNDDDDDEEDDNNEREQNESNNEDQDAQEEDAPELYDQDDPRDADDEELDDFLAEDESTFNPPLPPPSIRSMKEKLSSTKWSDEKVSEKQKNPKSFHNGKSVEDVAKSLIVKVYRGPTKQIDHKPFASWGYFIKFPNR